MAKLFIEDMELKGKRVLVRVDFNVPLDENLNVTDDTRIRASLPTINYIIDNGGRAILMSHLGRPKGTLVEKMRLKPAAKVLEKLIGRKVTALSDCIGKEVEDAVNQMGEGDVILLENLRFHKGEEANDEEFSQSLAKLADVYVNDAFGSSHRSHSSVVGVTKYIDKCAAGYLIQKEIKFLSETLTSPKRPFVAILGGAKISTKIGVIERLLNKTDALLIGGGMAFTFLKAMGKSVGSSLLEKDKIDIAGEIMSKAKERKVDFRLPEDYVIADVLENDANIKIVDQDGIKEGWFGVDIGPRTIAVFSKVIDSAETIFWNGPLGVFEKPNFSKGTFSIARKIADSKAISMVGGGDSTSAINQAGLADKITHISTGGGASLEYIEKGELPGINALTDK